MKLNTLSPSPAPGVAQQIEQAILRELPGAAVRVRAGQPGHFDIHVTSEEFRGKSRLESQRRVYRSIASLMSGDRAPVHAVDRLETVVG
jgi:acid stress-induced BolA-like protein IbaG/YrbA